MGNPHYPGKPGATPAESVPASARALATAVLVAALAMPGCGGGRDTVRTPPAPARMPVPTEWPVVMPRDPAAANAVLMRALSLVGTPYRYGGNTPEGGFDCSGLVAYVYRDMLDRALPRRTVDLAGVGPVLPATKVAAGDLVVFGRPDVSHVGIYVGEGRFVHAPSTGGTVRLDRIDGPYWRERFLGGRRVLR